MNIHFKNLIANLRAKGPTWVVFGAAAYQSFGHSIHLAKAHGASDAWLLPVSVDGVMIVAFHYVSHGKTKMAKGLAWVVLITFMLATLAINYLAAPAGDPIGQALSVLPALGMLATTVLIHLVPTKAPAVRRRTAVKKNNVTSIRKAS